MQKRPDETKSEYEQLYDQIDVLSLTSMVKCDGKFYNLGIAAPMAAGQAQVIGQPKISILILKEMSLEEVKKFKAIYDENLQREGQKDEPHVGT